jgi:hypothetical protein
MPTTALASRDLRAPGKSWDVLLGEGERARSTSLKVAAGGGYAASLTSIFFGSDLAGFGILILRTPFDIVASIFDGSMPAGS